MFAENPAIDVLLIDIGLPDGDGCDLLLELAAMRSVPAIAVTGYGQDKDRRKSLAAGFDEHMVKPISMDRVRELLDDFIRRRGGKNVG